MELPAIFEAQLMDFIVPAAIMILIIILAFLLRRFLYNRLHHLAAKTKSCWDDIMVQSTRLASILWCVLLGLYAGLISSGFVIQIPGDLQNILTRMIPILFALLGIYTVTVIIRGTIKWYRVEICPRTIGTMDNKLMAILAIVVPVIGFLLSIYVTLSILGIEIPAISNWLVEHAGKIVVLFILGIALLLATVLFVPKFIQNIMRNSQAEQTDEELRKRTETLINVIVTSLQVVILVIFFFMFLSELKIDISSILVGAGVVGLAIGFGAQSLVKDLIAGLFVIMENQYRKGDVVKIAETSGLVEEINLRRTVLRDMDGITHVVPNGEVRVASNFTKLWSRVNLNISVSYNTELDHAISVINRVGQDLAEDPQWKGAILTAPKVLRVDKLGESGIELKILGETKPIRQWDVMGELRLRLKKAFDKEGIEIPWPHTKVFFGNSPGDLWPPGKEPNNPNYN